MRRVDPGEDGDLRLEGTFDVAGLVLVVALLLLHVQDVRDAALLRVHSVQNGRWLLLQLDASAACATLWLTVLWEFDLLGRQINLVDLQWDENRLRPQAVVRDNLLV